MGRSVRSMVYRFSKSKAGLSLIWLIATFMISIFAFFIPKTITDILGPIFWIGTFTVGIYFTYRVGMFIDKKLSHSNTGLFTRRIVGGILSLFGLFISFAFYYAFLMTIYMVWNTQVKMFVGNMYALIFGFSIGMIFMGAYHLFVFKRESGVIVYRG